MEKLFVDQTILINAPASKVWSALTKSESTTQWASEFSSGGPKFHLESDWQLGSAVLWKSENNEIVVEGNVTALEPEKLLRFTVFDTRSEKPKVGPEDGITCKLSEDNGQTTLQVLQGDFSCIPDGNGQKYRDMSDQTWQRVLPIVKSIAEQN